MITIHEQRIEDFLTTYDGELFHALLTDPPYHLANIVARFGKPDSAPSKGGVFARVSRGFMGQTWDGGDIAFRPETWYALGELLYPGAFGMAFASARGWHRMAVAIEDAGFVMHPTIFGWSYGTGLPKGVKVRDRRQPVAVFEGHQYGTQVLKPALEPILVFQKPFASRRPVEDMLAYGAGTLNVDAERISHDLDASKGRVPANFLLLDDKAAQALDDQSGGASRFFYCVQHQLDRSEPVFYYKKASTTEREAGITGDAEQWTDGREKPIDNPYLRGGKPRKNPHPTIKPIDLARHLASLLLPPAEFAPRRLFVPFSGVGSECIGAKLAGWEEVVGVEVSEQYADIARQRAAYWETAARRTGTGTETI